jgi:hypothetical protein
LIADLENAGYEGDFTYEAHFDAEDPEAALVAIQENFQQLICEETE